MNGSHETPPRAADYPVFQQAQASEGRPVSFYLALFLALLLVLSVGLNVVMLLVGAFRSAAGSLGMGELGDGSYELVAVGGDPDASERILKVPIEGAIVEAASPLLGARGGMVTRVDRALRLAERENSIKGVLLYVNSPGGGVTDSDQIYRRVRDFRAETGKPVVALLGDMATSGGYYVACACEHILALETTITGSIGVILSQWNVYEAANDLGISEVQIVSAHTPHKGMLSPMQPMSPEEVAIARSIVDEMYERFVTVVDEGRTELERDAVQRVADGRIYSAEQAVGLGLVDGIGGEEEAIALLRQRAQIGSARVVEHRRRLSFLDALTGARASQEPTLDAGLAALLQGGTGPRLLYFWPGGR